MAVTKATLKASVLLACRAGPYTADAAFESRVEDLIAGVIRHVNAVMGWWYLRQGRTVTADQVEDELQALTYHGCCMAVHADLGRLERAQASAAVFQMLLHSFTAAHTAAGGGGAAASGGA